MKSGEGYEHEKRIVLAWEPLENEMQEIVFVRYIKLYKTHSEHETRSDVYDNITKLFQMIQSYAKTKPEDT